MSLSVTKIETVSRKIGGLVNHFTHGVQGKQVVSNCADGCTFSPSQARKYFKANGVEKPDIDRFISEARSLGEAFTDWDNMLKDEVDMEDLLRRIQEINSHLKALEQDTLIGPREERETGTKIKIEVKFDDTPIEERDQIKLMLSYGIKLSLWMAGLSSLAKRKLEEVELP